MLKLKKKNLILIMLNRILNIVTKLKKTSFAQGVIKGFNVDLLPNSVKFYYHSSGNRIFRVTGGLFTIAIVSKLHLHFDFLYINYIMMFISLLFLVQLLIINIIRIIYGIYIFLYKKEVYQVRNSPLNILASKWSAITLCLKYGICIPAAASGTIVTLGVVADSVHTAAGGSPFFIPWVALHWKEVYFTIHGTYPSPDISTNIEQTLSSQKPELPTFFTKEEMAEYEKLNPNQKELFGKEVRKIFSETLKSNPPRKD